MLIDNTRPSSSGETIIPNAEGIATIYDPTRNKNLSISRSIITFGINNKNITGTRWLQTTGGIPSNILGYKLPRNGVITSITTQTQNVSDCNFLIKKNNGVEIVYDLVLNSFEKIVDDLNIDFYTGDFIQIELVVNNSNVDYPLIVLEMAWR